MFRRYSFKQKVFRRFRVETKWSDSLGTGKRKKRASDQLQKEATGLYTFSSGEEVRSRAKLVNLTSNNKLRCKKCGSDRWTVVERRFLFWTVDVMYCQKCGKPLGDLKRYGYLGYKDFKKELRE